MGMRQVHTGNTLDGEIQPVRSPLSSSLDDNDVLASTNTFTAIYTPT